MIEAHRDQKSEKKPELSMGPICVAYDSEGSVPNVARYVGKYAFNMIEWVT